MPTDHARSPVPPRELTPRLLDTIKPTGTRFDVFDARVPGLALRVGPTGTKSWRLYYRHHGKLHRFTLGRYPGLGLAKARQRAEKLRTEVYDGAHPVREKAVERQSWGDTVKALVVQYGKSPAAKQRAWAEKARILRVDVVPVWGDRRVQDITRRDVRTLVEAKAVTAPIMGNRLLAHVCTLFNFALDREWIDANPAARLKPPSEERHRDRVLNPDEIRKFHAALTSPEPGAFVKAGVTLPDDTHRAAFLLLLYLGQRLTETCAMRWVDVDLAAAWWTIPAPAAKNKQAHRVPLPKAVLDLLETRADRADVEDVFVFPGRNRGSSIAARARKTAAIFSKALGFDFHAHDLRRTAASGMAAAGVTRFDMACVLNHRSVTQHGITAAYDHYQYDREKKAALQKWATALERLIAEPSEAGPTRGQRHG